MELKKSADSVVAAFGREGDPLALPPWYISGFVDGEGSFVFFLSPRKDIRVGYEVNLDFQIELRYDDRPILERIVATLGCGIIQDLNYKRFPSWQPHVRLRIGRIDDLYNKLCPFFVQYPLQAKKQRNFLVFQQAVLIKYQKRHTTPEGLEELWILRKEIEKLKG